MRWGASETKRAFPRLRWPPLTARMERGLPRRSLRLGLIDVFAVRELEAETDERDPAAEKNSEPADSIDLNAIKEQLRRLVEAIRRAMDEAAQSVDPKSGGAPPNAFGKPLTSTAKHQALPSRTT